MGLSQTAESAETKAVGQIPVPDGGFTIVLRAPTSENPRIVKISKDGEGNNKQEPIEGLSVYLPEKTPIFFRVDQVNTVLYNVSISVTEEQSQGENVSLQSFGILDILEKIIKELRRFRNLVTNGNQAITMLIGPENDLQTFLVSKAFTKFIDSDTGKTLLCSPEFRALPNSPEFKALTDGSEFKALTDSPLFTISIIASKAFTRFLVSKAFTKFIDSDAVKTLLCSSAFKALIDSPEFAVLIKSYTGKAFIDSDAFKALIESSAFRALIESSAFKAFIESHTGKAFIERVATELLIEGAAVRELNVLQFNLKAAKKLNNKLDELLYASEIPGFSDFEAIKKQAKAAAKKEFENGGDV